MHTHIKIQTGCPISCENKLSIVSIIINLLDANDTCTSCELTACYCDIINITVSNVISDYTNQSKSYTYTVSL